MTEQQEILAGEKLAEIFCLKRSKEHPDRWVMGGGYLTKTSLGVFRVFKDLVIKLEVEGRIE
jgi:hypothetical protein